MFCKKLKQRIRYLEGRYEAIWISRSKERKSHFDLVRELHQEKQHSAALAEQLRWGQQRWGESYYDLVRRLNKERQYSSALHENNTLLLDLMEILEDRIKEDQHE